MKGFTPGLFDRLMDLPIEALKDSVARDLEALLNTRTVVPEALLERYPECARPCGAMK